MERLLELDRVLEDAVAYLYALLGIVEGDDPLAQMDAQPLHRDSDEVAWVLTGEFTFMIGDMVTAPFSYQWRIWLIL